MLVINLSETNSIIYEKLREIRDVNLQKNKILIKENLIQLGFILAYESSKNLDYNVIEITTPFCKTKVKSLQENPVIYSMLRASLPFVEGISRIYTNSDISFFAGSHLQSNPTVDFFTSTSIDKKTLIIADPMMITGSTVKHALETIKTKGCPKKIILLSVILTKYAITELKKILPKDSIVFTCNIDVFSKNIRGTKPGIGDIGDLLYGKKKN